MLPRLVPRAARGAARRCGAGLRRLLSESAPARLPVEVTRVTTLSNGLRVATERVHAECETVTLGVWFDCGSRYEAVENNGAAHFLEHIAFKGTRRRSQYQLEKAIEDMGAHLNAYTSREQTVYYARLFKADVAQGMDVLADILQHSLIDTQAVEKERGTILREMEEVYKNHEERVLDLLHEAAYKDGGLGRTILGPEENIKRITAPDLRAYIETHYTAPRTVIVAAGAVDHDEIVALSEKYWSNLPEASRTDFAVDFEPAKFTPEEVRLPDEAEPRTHIGIAFDGASWTSEYSVPLMVLQTLVGQWDRMNPVAGGAETSPFKLARTLAREDAAHLYLSFNTCYHDGGIFGLYIVAPPESADIVVQRVMEYLASLSEDGAFTEDDVERAKTQLKANILCQLDSLAHVAEEIGRQILTYQRRMPISEVLARIDAVTVSDVTVTARHFLQDKDHAMAVYGAVENVPPYEDNHIKNFSKSKSKSWFNF